MEYSQSNSSFGCFHLFSKKIEYNSAALSDASTQWLPITKEKLISPQKWEARTLEALKICYKGWYSSATATGRGMISSSSRVCKTCRRMSGERPSPFAQRVCASQALTSGGRMA